MTVLITGATGQLGSLVVKHLLDRIPASDIAVSVRKPEKAADLAARGIDVRAGDFNDLALMTTAFKGIETALIISAEDDNATRIKQHRTAVDAAKAAGVKHIVYTGIVDPKADADFTYSAIHLDTENYIRESGLAFTILRNSFMQTCCWPASRTRLKPAISAPRRVMPKSPISRAMTWRKPPPWCWPSQPIT